MVWKSYLMFVRVSPYESGVKFTNFIFSWQNGEVLHPVGATHFLTQNEELSKQIGACICIYTRVYTNTWQRGAHCAPAPPPWIGLITLQWNMCLVCADPLLKRAMDKFFKDRGDGAFIIQMRHASIHRMNQEECLNKYVFFSVLLFAARLNLRNLSQTLLWRIFLDQNSFEKAWKVVPAWQSVKLFITWMITLGFII